MKKHIKAHASVKRTFSGLIIGCATLLSVTAHAQAPVDGPQVRISAAALYEGRPTFQVLVKKESRELYDLAIVDDKGLVLYSEALRGEFYGRRFQLDAPSEDATVFIRIISRKSHEEKLYPVTQVNAVASLR